MNDEYEIIMSRLKDMSTDDNMVNMDAVAEVVWQVLKGQQLEDLM